MAYPTNRTLDETLRQDIPSPDSVEREADAKGRFSTSYFPQLKTDKEGRLWVNSDVIVQRLDAIEGLLSQLLQELQVQRNILAQGLNVNADTF